MYENLDFFQKLVLLLHAKALATAIVNTYSIRKSSS